jgi:hypothetical protein
MLAILFVQVGGGNEDDSFIRSLINRNRMYGGGDGCVRERQYERKREYGGQCQP